MRDQSIILPGSYCPSCKHSLCWYDNIPLLSYFLLRGKCRYCKNSISYLYPLIEFITAVSFYAIITLVDPYYRLAYFFFFSALIVTTRTDLEKMLISRYATLMLIPFGWGLSITGRLPLSFSESLIGSIAGYLILFIIAQYFYWITKRQGMGEGDAELLAFIGAFIGPLGIWATLTLASILGAIVGIFYMVIFKQKQTLALPFAPFLVLGAMTYVLFENDIFSLVFG